MPCHQLWSVKPSVPKAVLSSLYITSTLRSRFATGVQIVREPACQNDQLGSVPAMTVAG